MDDKIKYVITKLKKINEDANGFGLQTIIALASQTNTVRHVTTIERETDSFSVEPDVVGRDGYVSEIVEKLIVARLEEKISVIPIVGMGGIGKTTIARTVFHDEMIRIHFDEKIWVLVPIDFDALSLFNWILETKEEESVTSKEAALHKIRKLLCSKRYLLILDDIWSKENWDEFMKPLQKIGDKKGNCILVTTRNENVASHVKTLPTRQLGRLSDIQCWYIIKAETCKGMDITEEFERIGERIAERCDGLPLAAKVVGGLLRGKSEENWSNILENKPSDGDDDDITKILRLSYDNFSI